MLSRDDNELLTRIGPGTPMGNLVRQFWFPLLPSTETPAAGGRPMRMRLLGEELVLFRNSEGKVGLLAEFCSHRSASLYFGRNEDGGLRCVYHGWLFSPDGRCLDMPNERIGESFKQKIRHGAYPCREINGVVWTYMGPRAEPPPLPEYGLATMPANQKAVRLTVRDCNWMQAVEGDLDLSHGAYLHSPLSSEHFGENHLDRYMNEVPDFDAVETDFGISHCVRRHWDDDHAHCGVGHFLFPFMTTFPPVGDNMETNPGHVWIPMDDRTTLVWTYQWHPTTPLADVPLDHKLGGGQGSQGIFDSSWEQYLPETPEPASKWRQKACVANAYGFDEDAQLNRRYSGIATVELQDRGLQESMRPIADRTNEHLGATDVAIIAVRRRLLEAAKMLRDEGVVPECVDKPEQFSVRSASGIVRHDLDWREGTRDWVRDGVGVPMHSRGHLRPEWVVELKSR